MKPGRYAADDGSFGRSTGVAMGRGVLLLAVALVIGIILLNAASDDPPGTRVSSSPARTRPTEPPVATTAPVTSMPPAVHAPKDVKVLVANGSATSKVATNASAPLKTAGFNVLAPGNADKVQESSVFAQAGYEADAAAIATALGLPAAAAKAMPAVPPVKSDANPNVIVVIGAADAARFAAATTSTTAKTTGTTAKASSSTTARAGASSSTTAATSTSTTAAR